MNGIDQKEVKMLTKARLDQYIKDNELVPIGTELITVQGGVGKVISNTYGRSSVYLCEFVNGPQLSYTKEFKYIEDNIHTSLIDPTPSTVESPFSKEMLEQMVSDVEDIRKVVGYSDTRGKIISTCNHLLTNANEFPKQMLVGDHNPPTIDANVVYIDPQQRFVVVQTEMNYEAYMYFAPIEQKPKELKDVKADEYVWCVKNNSMGSFGEKIQVTKVENDLIYLDVVSRVQWIGKNNLMFQAYPPTSAQITAAEEAAINEVKQGFDKARKEVEHG